VNRIALRQLTSLACATSLVCLISGCSSLEEDKINYKSASKQLPTLEVPPDLTQIRRDGRYQINGATSALAMATGNSTPNSGAADTGVAPNQAGDARIERVGNQRVLIINLSPTQVWEPLKEFWKDNGFEINLDQPDLGIMETDWAENRGKIPQDFIRRSIGKALDMLYGTGERDKFRTRVERSSKGLEITITHRGMTEVYTGPLNSNTAWTARASEPELEIEFLRRLMLRLGGQTTAATPSNAVQLIGTKAPEAGLTATGVKLIKLNNLQAIEISDNFDRAWRRVGVAIDRTGFTVEDRDRAQGVFFVRYAPMGSSDKEPGFFAKIFSSEKATPTLAKYRITVTSKGEVSNVQVQDADGMPETSVNADKIIKLLAEEIK